MTLALETQIREALKLVPCSWEYDWPGEYSSALRSRLIAAQAAVTALRDELAKAKSDAARLVGLIDLCGHLQDGSFQDLEISADDATSCAGQVLS